MLTQTQKLNLTKSLTIINKMKTKPLLLSLGLILGLSSCEEEKKKETEIIPLPNVRVNQLIAGDFKHWVELQGTIETSQDVMLTPQVGGTIRRISVVEGQTVRKGQLIAYMDNSIIGSNIAEAEAALDNARYNYNKQEELNKAGVGTKFNFRQTYDQVKISEKRIASLKAQAGKAAVFAPFDGIIDEIYPSVGEVGGPGIPICHLVGVENMTVAASLSESFISKVSEGTKVRVILPALDTVISDLTINRVSRYINPTNRTFTVYVDIPNEQKHIVPNMVAKVQINDATYINALQVDNSSIQYDKNGETYFFRLKDLGEEAYVSEFVRVKRVSSYDGKTVITSDSDLSDGDLIVTDGSEGIQNADTVKILK